MSFPRYPEYKNSGVEWLGEVPAHWDLPRLKHLARIRNGRDYKDVEVESGGYPVIGSGGEFTRASSYLYKGESILLGRKGTIDKPLYINGAFWTVDTMFYTELSSRVNGRFLFYHSTCFRFDQYSTNTALPSMAQEDLANIQLAAPEPQEQAQIAAFLDHETSRIDALVEEQKRLIELLKEKRQAVISHAVTKGLDPDVPMKDSGVEWLGEVPAHWGVQAVNQVTQKITNGYVGPTRDILVDDGVPYIQATHIKNGVIKFDGQYFVAPEWSKKMRKSILQQGDVLIVQTGAGTGDVAVATSNEEGCNCHALIILQPISKILLGGYFGWFLQSRMGQSVLFSLRTGGMHPHLNCGEVKFIKLPLPPKEEQFKISSYISTASRKIDELVAEAVTAIKCLQERRSALISAAVTGKIDVRGWQPAVGSQASTSTTQTEVV